MGRVGIGHDDEPDRPASVFPALEPNPLVPQSFNGGASTSKASLPDGTPPPTPDRLMGVLASGSLPATSPLGSKRPMPFDQDLADMLDDGDPADGTSLSAPKPVARSDAGFLSSTKNAEPAAKPPVAAPADTALPPHFASPPQPASSTPQPPPPFGGASATSPVSPAPPTRTFGFPPLRKQSFYPPQAPVTPTLSPLPAAERDATASAGDKTDKPAADTGGLDEALKRLTGLGAVVPGEPATPTTPLGAMPSFGAPLVNGSASNGSLRAPEASLHAPESSSRAPEATFASVRPGDDAEAPASPAAGKPFKSETPFGLSAKPDRAAADAPKDHAPRFDDKPAHAGMNGSALNGASKPAFAEPAKPHFSEAQPEPSAVAAQALDALAQGLAASAASAALTAIPLTPVPEPGAATAVRAPQPAMPDLGNLPLAAPQGAPARTLEDAVADMLRPMLQKWVADNMPRIIERALRVEVGNTKPTGKPPSGT
jgi:cell pole-organizing protein PopZ